MELLCRIAAKAAEDDPGKIRDLLAEAEHAAAAFTGPTAFEMKFSFMFDDPRKVLAQEMAKIASVVLRRDRAEAEQIARTIRVPGIRDSALRDIATVIAGHDQVGAVRITSTLDPGTFRDQAIEQVIEAIAEQDPEHAEQIASSTAFSDPQYQAKVLISIARAVARRGPRSG